MKCQKCIAHPGFHIFIKFATVNDIMFIYSAPSKSLDSNKDGTKLENIRIHIDEFKGPWIWVWDFGGMGYKDYTDFSFNMSLFNTLAKNKYLQEIWITRSNIWIQGVISFFKTISSEPLLQRIKFMDGSPFEIYQAFRKEGMDAEHIKWLLNEQTK